MSDDVDEPDAAEERLAALLLLVQREPVSRDPRLTRMVLDRARFELRVRRALGAVTIAAHSLASGLRLLLGSRAGGPRR
jgi:hypothetical protein